MNKLDYGLVNAAFMRKARTLTKYFKHDWQVTDKDNDVERGGDYFLITRPGALPIGPVPGLNTKKLYYVSVTITFDLQHRWKNYGTSWPAFGEMRDAIVNLYAITKDKTLPSPTAENPNAKLPGVDNISINAPEPPGQKPPPPGTPTWIGQTLSAVILLRIDVDAPA